MFGKISLIPIIILFRIIAILPFSILYYVSKLIYFFLFWIIGYRRHVVNMNLNYALPYMPNEKFTPIAKNFYRHLSELLVEIIKGFYISSEELNKRITLDKDSRKLLNKLSSQNKNIVLMLGHYGNWEWALLIIQKYTQLKAYSLYTSLSNKAMDKYILKKRERFGATMIDATKDKSKLRTLKSTPSILAIVGDQSPTGRNKVHNTQFLNLNTNFFIGGERIAKDLDAIVLSVNIQKLSFANYKIYLELITDNIQSLPLGQMTEIYKSKLETQIINQPEYWIWSHKRWKSSIPY